MPAAYLFTRRKVNRACHQIRLEQPLDTSKSQSFPSEKQAVRSFVTLSLLVLL